MLSALLTEFYERDLMKVKEELNLYADEQSVWTLKPGINNSAGTLGLHITGNLLHFIGAVLGKTGYIRDRDKEFSLRNVSRQELNRQLDETIEVIRKTLPGITDVQMEETFPIELNKKTVTTGYVVVHLAIHLGYHLGQISYHRRMI